MLPMAKNIIHISEAEAASDFAAVLARVRAGAEIVIEGHEPVVVVRAEPVRVRLLSECIALAKAHEEETGKVPVLDPDFAADVEEIVKNRKCGTPPRGNNPRFQRHHHCRAPRSQRPANPRTGAIVDKIA